MANNRMYLKCNACNGVWKLGTFNYTDGWYDNSEPADMNEFYDEHKECWYMIQQNQTCNHNHPLFSLEFESIEPDQIPICEAFPLKSWKEE